MTDPTPDGHWRIHRHYPRVALPRRIGWLAAAVTWSALAALFILSR